MLRLLLLPVLCDEPIISAHPHARLLLSASSPAVVDGSFGEILTTCEKLRWTLADGEETLRPEYRCVCVSACACASVLERTDEPPKALHTVEPKSLVDQG